MRLRSFAMRSATRLSNCKGWDVHAAEDLAQEALIRLWTWGSTVRSPRAWLERVVQHLGKDGARGRATLPGPARWQSPEAESEQRIKCHSSLEPEAQSLLRDIWDHAPRLFEELPPPCREIATLQYLREWSRREIQGWLHLWRGTSEGEFRGFMSRTHSMLRALGRSESPRGIWPDGWTKKNRWRTIPPPNLRVLR